MKKNIAIVFLLVFSIGMVSCTKSDDYSTTYEYPTILKIVGSGNVVAGAGGFTTKYSTYYLGSSVTLTWTSSSPADVTVTPTPGNSTEATYLFKPSAAGKTITVTVTASNGIVGTKTVTVN